MKLHVAVMGGTESGKTTLISKLHGLQTMDLGLNLKKLANVKTLHSSKHVDDADVFILLFAVNNMDTFEAVAQIRDMVMLLKGPDVPILIVANKIELEWTMDRQETQNLVVNDWENAYVECSMRFEENIHQVLESLINISKESTERLSSNRRLSRHLSFETKVEEKLSPRFQRRRSKSLNDNIRNFRRDRRAERRRSSTRGIFNQVANCLNPFGANTNF